MTRLILIGRAGVQIDRNRSQSKNTTICHIKTTPSVTFHGLKHTQCHKTDGSCRDGSCRRRWSRESIAFTGSSSSQQLKISGTSWSVHQQFPNIRVLLEQQLQPPCCRCVCLRDNDERSCVSRPTLSLRRNLQNGGPLTH